MSPAKSSKGKLDFKKDFKTLYAASAKEPSVVDVAHNEIYLGDPRRSDPAKLKTIIRQPVRKK